MDFNPSEKKKRGLCVSPFQLFSREVIVLEQNCDVKQMEKDVLYNMGWPILYFLSMHSNGALNYIQHFVLGVWRIETSSVFVFWDLYLYEHQIKRLIGKDFEGKFREIEKERKRGHSSLASVQFKILFIQNESHDYRLQYLGLGWG